MLTCLLTVAHHCQLNGAQNCNGLSRMCPGMVVDMQHESIESAMMAWVTMNVKVICNSKVVCIDVDQ